MRNNRLFLVQMSPAARPVILAAATAAFPGARLVEVATVEEAAQHPAVRQPDLMILADPDELAAARAVQAADSGGLPRWAVVILGGTVPDLAETVPADEWSAPLLARVFRSTLLQHELLCENLRLRGDLRTVARRISHDLRTPVGCIHTSSSVLKVLPPDDAPAIGAMIQTIEDSSTELSRIIDRVSFVLKASADPSSPINVTMGPLVDRVLRELAPDIEQADATILQPVDWPEVAGVAPWLEAIWRNLVVNALKHGGPATEVQLGWSLDGGDYRFTVADRGPGISAQREQILFQPFDQLHLRPTPGLGLSLVQRLVSLQGGACGYARLADGSSVFHFTLPIAAVSAAPARSDPPPPPPRPATAPKPSHARH
jgi:signal transduction histidine kinase